MVRADGTEVGTHPGTMGFTVGQRRGLGVATGEPLYVVGIEAGERRLVVGGDGEVLSREVHLRALNFLVPAPGGPLRVLARIRSRHPDVPALLEPEEPGVRRGGQARLVFDDPVRAAAPGQAAVFYDPERPERLLGGGLIQGRGSPPERRLRGVREHLRGGEHGVGSPREGGGRRVRGLVQEVSASPPAW